MPRARLAFIIVGQGPSVIDFIFIGQQLASPPHAGDENHRRQDAAADIPPKQSPASDGGLFIASRSRIEGLYGLVFGDERFVIFPRASELGGEVFDLSFQAIPLTFGLEFGNSERASLVRQVALQLADF